MAIEEVEEGQGGKGIEQGEEGGKRVEGVLFRDEERLSVEPPSSSEPLSRAMNDGGGDEEEEEDDGDSDDEEDDNVDHNDDGEGRRTPVITTEVLLDCLSQSDKSAVAPFSVISQENNNKEEGGLFSPTHSHKSTTGGDIGGCGVGLEGGLTGGDDANGGGGGSGGGEGELTDLEIENQQQMAQVG